MLEWDVMEEENPLPDLPAEEAPPGRSRRFWAAVVLAGVAVALLLAFVVYREMVNRRELMRADLEAFIRQEEQARAFGLRQQAAHLIAAGVSWEWWVNYLDSFARQGDRPHPLDIQLVDVKFDGQGALVTLTVNGHRQMRYYRLVNQAWRRAMLPVEEVWGTRRFAVEPIEGVDLIYRPPDRAFAWQVARDLPALFTTLADWPERPRVVQIEIEPRDMAPPLIAADEQRVVLNSPLLVPQDGVLSGEGAVRLALATALLDQADGADESALSLPLLNATRFLEAARTVAAMHWALSPEEQAQQRNAWRETLGEWLSPFEAIVALDPPQEAAVLIRRTDAAALLTAEYIYQTEGAAVLAAIVRRLPRADTWDEVFLETLGRPRDALEREVAAFVVAGTAGEGVPESRVPASRSPLEPPLDAELLAFRSGRTVEALVGPDRLRVEIELPARRNPIYADDGQPVAAGCLGPHSRARVEGKWVVKGERFQAERVTLTVARLPLVLRPLLPPADTLGYVVRRDPFRPAEVLAVGRRGVLGPVLELENAVHIRPLPPDGGPVRFAITFFVPACPHYWVVLYAPREGLVAKWLAKQESTAGTAFFHTVWRPEGQDMLFFLGAPAGGTWQYHAFRAGPGMLMAMPLGRLLPGFLPLGWSSALDRIVALDLQAEQPTVALVDETLRPAETWPLPGPPSAFSLSPDGQLAAVTLHPSAAEGRATLLVLDLTDGGERLSWAAPPGTALGDPTWSAAGSGQQVLAVPVGPDPDRPSDAPVRISLFNLSNGRATFTEAFEAFDAFSPSGDPADLTNLRGIVFCGTKRLMWLYRQPGYTVLATRNLMTGVQESVMLLREELDLLGCEESEHTGGEQ